MRVMKAPPNLFLYGSTVKNMKEHIKLDRGVPQIQVLVPNLRNIIGHL